MAITTESENQTHFEALARAFLDGVPYFGPAATVAGLAAQREYFQNLIAKLRQPNGKKKLLSILEINSGTGASCIAWAEQIRNSGFGGKVVCIDEAWKPKPRRNSSGDGDIYRLFKHNIRAAGVEQLVRPLFREPDIVLAKLPDQTFDIVSIVGSPSHLISDHIMQAKRLVRKGGIICGVDSKSSWLNVSARSHPFPGLSSSTAGDELTNPTDFAGTWAVRRQAKGWRQISNAELMHKSGYHSKQETRGRSLGHTPSVLTADRSPMETARYLPVGPGALHKTSILLPSIFPKSLITALENIRRSTHGAYEIIVVSSFMASGPNIVWIQETEPKGASYAQARAAEAASGDFLVAFSDDHRLVDGWDLTAARDLRNLESRSGAEICCIGLQFANWNFTGTVFGKYYANFPFMRRQIVRQIGWIDEEYEKGFGDCDLSMRIWDAGGICEPSSRPLIAIHHDDFERPKPLYTNADVAKFISRWAPKCGIGWNTTEADGFNINIEQEIGSAESNGVNSPMDRSGMNNNELNLSLQTLKSQVNELWQTVETQKTEMFKFEAQIAQAQHVSLMADDDLRRALEASIVNFAQKAADIETLRALDDKICSVESRVGKLREDLDEQTAVNELINRQVDDLQNLLKAHNQAQVQFEDSLSALTANIAEQSDLTKEQIAGLATLLEIQSTATDQQFAERVKAHESVSARLAGLVDEYQGSRLERDVIQVRITEFADLLLQHQSTLESIRRSPMFRGLLSLHLIPARKSI